MANIAGLYRVRGHSGAYYAVFDPATGRLWTERSEHSARAQAAEAGLDLAPERAITHQALMQLSGRDTAGPQPAKGPTPSSTPRPSPPNQNPTDTLARPIISRAPFIQSDPGPGVLTERSTPIGGNLFSADEPVAPPIQDGPSSDESDIPSAGSVFSRDVLDEKRPLPRAKGKNPFADRKHRRKN